MLRNNTNAAPAQADPAKRFDDTALQWLRHAQQVEPASERAGWLIGIALRQHFPQYYDYFSVRSFRFGKRTINGHNRLLGSVRGVDGIKTGYTRASGYNLVTSAVADGRSVVGVVIGGRSGAARSTRRG